ncbi:MULTISPECIES: CidA/LrgA family protein [Marinobacter]|uniref:Holin-like protein n=1 Tax=Marinobacter segnicrescens TaxID=430453 RepID=A0A1I0CF88_9GAMM|nr:MULTISPECIES: CidA/LrgA family protein [Marinobacter]UZD64957.1 CidA/LrgA family protein [Marinobacter sp. AN1]SET18065.1 holin-like protein [Marinobacter segnicrescens]
MSFLVGVTLLLVLQLIGEVTVRLLAWPVPGPVLGMILLFVFLLARKGVSESLATASSGLLAHLSLLFVPAGVGVMVHGDRLMAEWLPVVAVLLVTTVLTMLVTAAVMMLATRWLVPGYRTEEKDHE